MKTVEKKNGDVLIYLPTDANRDFGLFLIFIGIIATPPSYWLFFWFTQKPFHDWRPSIFIGIIWVIVGILLICFSNKKIILSKSFIKISDGLFRKPFTIKWKNFPSIKLKYDEEERKGQIKEYWETSLLDGKLEYTIERREHHQLEARALGEKIAKFLMCPFIEKNDEGKETTIDPKDVDLSFRQRILKYPGLLRTPVDRPKNAILNIEERKGAILVSWGIQSTGILLDALLFTFFFLLFSILPMKEGSLSFYEQCARRSDFFVFYAAGAIILILILVVLGYRARFHLSRYGAIFWVTIWNIQMKKKKIMIDRIEEIRLTPSVRGPRVQVISDAEIISFRLFDRAASRWLSYQLQEYMMKNKEIEESSNEGYNIS